MFPSIERSTPAPIAPKPMAQVFEAADVAGIRISDPAPGRGMTTCNLSDAHGKPLTFQLGSAEAPLRSPFGAGVYGGAEENAKATRLNLDALVTGRDDVIAKFREIDAQIVEWLRANQDKFPRVRNPHENYRPLLVENAEYGTTRIHLKMNTAGLNQAKGWTLDDKARVPDLKQVNFRETPFILIFQISKLWSMSKEIGCTCEVKHVILTSGADDVFPMDLS